MMQRSRAGKTPQGDNTQMIRDLESKGYRDSFSSVVDIDAAKICAKKYRSTGFFARVVTINSVGRVYNRISIRVYIKEK